MSTLSNIWSGLTAPSANPMPWMGSYNKSTTPAGPAAPSSPAPAQPVFKGKATSPAAPAAVAAPVDMYAKYRNPETGVVMNPQEYSDYWSNKLPQNSNGPSDVPTYAGNALANPDQSANALNTTATNLNNARNDIATGATDPYKVGSQSGIPYTAAELKAIENAYAGVYDPALNDVFSRLKDKQTTDAAQAKRDDQIFQTNENIRQWRATTGSKGGGGGTASDLFTKTQLNTAARNAGVGITAAQEMDPDLVNFFLAPPKSKGSDGKVTTIDKIFASDMQAVKDGTLSADQLSQDITDAPGLSEAVKTYFISQIPNEPAKQANFFQQIWSALTQSGA